MNNIKSKGPTSGGCLCGAVQYQISGKMRAVVACHCRQCQKTSGHYVAATRVAIKDLQLQDCQALQWYQSSEVAKRGFCRLCGSNLFWKSDSQNISIFAGTLNSPSGLSLTKHIFVADKADYYELTDDLPKFERFD